MGQPQLVVRVAGNLEQLKKDLKEGEKAVQATSGQIQKLANSFNGDRLVTHAHNVTAAIKEVGVTTLTASQASRNLDMLERAMDKMSRTSQPIPETMKRTAEQLRFMARTSEEAIPTGQKLTQTYRQFDGVLQAMGINIGPYVKGLEDVSNAYSGIKTAGTGAAAASTGAAGAIAAAASAAAVLASAVAGWKLGESISNTYGLSKAIAEGTASLMGYGDMAQQVALALADANDAQLHFMKMKKLQAQTVEEDTRAAREQSEELKRTWTVTEGNTDALKNLQTQLDATRAKKLEDARASFAASQAQGIFGKETEKTTEKVQEQNTALDERAESVKRIMDAEAARKKQVDDFMNAPTLNDQQSQESSFELGPLGGFELDNTIARFRQAGEKDPAKALQRALSTLESMEGKYDPTDNKSFFDMQRDQLLLAQLRLLKGSGKIPGFAGGVENFSGGPAIVGERGPELVTLPRGASVTPNHAMGGVTIAAGAIVIQGTVVGGVDQLAEKVGAAIMTKMRGQGVRFGVGA